MGGPLSPTLSKMVVDSVIRPWVTLVLWEEAGPYGFRQAVQCLAALFYTDNDLLALPIPTRI